MNSVAWGTLVRAASKVPRDSRADVEPTVPQHDLADRYRPDVLGHCAVGLGIRLRRLLPVLVRLQGEFLVIAPRCRDGRALIDLSQL